MQARVLHALEIAEASGCEYLISQRLAQPPVYPTAHHRGWTREALSPANLLSKGCVPGAGGQRILCKVRDSLSYNCSAQLMIKLERWYRHLTCACAYYWRWGCLLEVRQASQDGNGMERDLHWGEIQTAIKAMAEDWRAHLIVFP